MYHLVDKLYLQRDGDAYENTAAGFTTQGWLLLALRFDQTSKVTLWWDSSTPKTHTFAQFPQTSAHYDHFTIFDRKQ